MGLPQVTPIWVANTAYLVGARVTATTPDGLNWYATVAGTSGGTEPVWPTAEPWTVTDGGVTWRLATSYRQLTRDGLITTLKAFRSANPWALIGVSSSRPKSLSNFPMPGAFIDAMDEQVTTRNGVRTRQFTGLTVVLVVPVPDNDEASNATDCIVDALQDAFTAAYHAADGSSITEQTGVTEVTLDDGGPKYLANIFAFATSAKAEGRT